MRAELMSGFETQSNSHLVQLLERLTGQKAGTVAFGTEAAQMMELGAEAVVLGPGNIRVAHQTGEFVPNDQLNRCVRNSRPGHHRDMRVEMANYRVPDNYSCLSMKLASEIPEAPLIDSDILFRRLPN